jgi:hypothetical protein
MGEIKQKTCKYCGKKFFPLHSSKGIFCSSACAGKYHTGSNSPTWKGGKIKRICKVCGKSFYVYPAEVNRANPNSATYCSKSCRMKGLQPPHVKGKAHPNFGKHLSEETKEKLSISKKGRYAGEKNPFYGKTHSLKTRIKMSIARCEFFDNGGEIWSKGKKAPQLSGKNNPMYGRKCCFPYYYKNGGKRDDLNQYFRSSWEANIARFFNHMSWGWIYEPKRFYFDDCSYLPDFYLPHIDTYVEVKGYMRKKDLERINKFKQFFPELRFWLIDARIYRKIYNKFSSVLNDNVVIKQEANEG